MSVGPVTVPAVLGEAVIEVSEWSVVNYQVTLDTPVGSGPAVLMAQARGSLNWEPVVDADGIDVEIAFSATTLTHRLLNFRLKALRLKSATTGDTFNAIVSTF